MKKQLICIFVLICMLLTFACASASALTESINTADVSVKNGRLFEVKLGFKSNRTITAAKFTLVYNSADIVVRKPECNLSRAKVRLNDKNGKTEVIFLCSSGVSCKEFPFLFSVKYKKLNDNNTKISIKASDCVDSGLNNFTPPASAVCHIKADLSSSGFYRGGNGSSGKSGGYYSSGKSDKQTSSSSDGGSEENIIIDDDEPETKVISNSDDPLYYKAVPFIALSIIIFFAGILIYQNTKITKAEKQKAKEEKSDNLPKND